MTDQSASPSPENHLPGEPAEQLVDLARVETLLTHGIIVPVQGATLWGSNYALLVTVADSDLQTLAVYKPQRGERPLWDFPNGTLCYRETLAYMVSQALGWHVVPPTVLRAGSHGIGSLQLFIDHNPEITYFSLDDRFIDQLQRFALFDEMVNNTDRKGGHLLMDSRGKLWGIDQGLTFHTQPKLRTVIWEFAGDPIGDSLLNDVARLRDQICLPDNHLRCKIEELLGTNEAAALLRRIDTLLARKTFPLPGPGPNRPWPPI